MSVIFIIAFRLTGIVPEAAALMCLDGSGGKLPAVSCLPAVAAE